MTDNSDFTEFRRFWPQLVPCLIGGLVLIQGCATQTPPAPVTKAGSPAPPLPIQVPAAPNSSPDPATYLSKLKSLSGAQIQREVTIGRQQLRELPTDENRLRLALALWTSGGDDLEIQMLAESTQRNIEHSQIRGIGSLLLSIIAERRRNRELLSSIQSRSREARKELESQQIKTESMQKQIAELERKLAALKDMEKSLIQRP